MSIGETFLPEFDQEMSGTRKVLERVPADKGQWRPHPKSFPMGHLAQLVSWMPGWIAHTLQHSRLDLLTAGSYTFETTDVLLKAFDANVKAAREALASTPDPAWSESWELTRGELVLWKAPRTVVVRNHINHTIHHRAQLGVYLRLNEIPLPALYGPSADERVF
jgi:uncharacterized damage-inducible protein DinB